MNIKRCPFCAESPKIESRHPEPNQIRIFCDNDWCDIKASSHYYPTLDEAHKEWECIGRAGLN